MVVLRLRIGGIRFLIVAGVFLKLNQITEGEAFFIWCVALQIRVHIPYFAWHRKNPAYRARTKSGRKL